MLTRLDEYPRHQIATTFDYVASSDLHWNDGYWFGVYSEEAFLFTGMRVHANQDVIDGYAGIICDGRQHNIRFSRRLRPNIDDIRVGPLRYDILEGLKQVRLRLDENEFGLRFDVVWTAVAPPFEEAHYFGRRGARVINDLMRYTQNGRAEGSIRLGDRTFTVNPDTWWGARDHSWGIRSTMGPPDPLDKIAPAPSSAPRIALRLWVPFQLPGQSGFYHLHDDPEGRRLDFEGRIDFHEAGGVRSVPLVDVQHQIEHFPGSYRLRTGKAILHDAEGGTWHHRYELILPPAYPRGFGYTGGYHDGLNPGVYRGDYHQEGEVWETADPTAEPDRRGHRRALGGTEHVCRLACNGEIGLAHVEHMVYKG